MTRKTPFSNSIQLCTKSFRHKKTTNQTLLTPFKKSWNSNTNGPIKMKSMATLRIWFTDLILIIPTRCIIKPPNRAKKCKLNFQNPPPRERSHSIHWMASMTSNLLHWKEPLLPTKTNIWNQSIIDLLIQVRTSIKRMKMTYTSQTRSSWERLQKAPRIESTKERKEWWKISMRRSSSMLRRFHRAVLKGR